MKHKTEDTLFLVGGALLGAAAMYLLDPDAGSRRRRLIAKAAEHAYEGTQGAIEDCWDNFSSGAKGAHDTAADYTHDLASQARSIASGLTGKAADYIHSGSKSAQDYVDQAQSHGMHLRDMGGKLWNRARHMGEHLRDAVMHRAHNVHDDSVSQVRGLGKKISKRASSAADQTASWLGYKPADEGVSATAVVTTAIGCCAVGAGMVYFLDSERGSDRRSMVVNKTVEFVQKTGNTMWSTGNHIAEQISALFHGTSGPSAAMQRADSRELVGRIRSALSNTAGASQFQLMADADGTVTVMGGAQQDQIENILGLIHAVPGVNSIINRLEGRGSSASDQQNSSQSAVRM